MKYTLRLILGDQLNHHHPWFENRSDDVIYVMMEVRQETDYVAHHIQKILAFFMAMRSFAQWLQQNGHRVIYIDLAHPQNSQDFASNIQWIVEQYPIKQFEYQLPDEYRLDEQFNHLAQLLPIPVLKNDTCHFLTERTELQTFFKGKKTYLMEHFYRHMRKKFNLLMQGSEPLGGAWNYDAENRKKLPEHVATPPPLTFTPPDPKLIEMVVQSGIKTIGHLPKNEFYHPTTRKEALALLDYFCQHCLPYFGTYEDAMRVDGPFLFHSRLSFALNVKLLHPLEVVHAAIKHFQQRPDEISLPQIEGFVRQIIGWREYMRGVYWAHMPDYAQCNFFEHNGKLPSWFWTGKTKMKCLQQCITQSLEYAYAHHIQRLMITGNFCLLLGVHPDEVDAWYLGIYSDAIQWVEITNTRGMSQFADGGLVATKPYVSSANYISGMSNYCEQCHYDKKDRLGERACPFNALYWNFYIKHRDKLAQNPRIGMAYRQLERLPTDELTAIAEKAAWIKSHIEQL